MTQKIQPTSTQEHEELLSELIQKALTGTIEDKRISLYSHPALVLLRYADIITPGFSRSGAAGQLISDLLKKHNSTLWDYVDSKFKDSEIVTRGNKQFWSHVTIESTETPIITEKALDQAIEETQERMGRTVTIYSPQISVIFKYLASIEPRFSISKNAAELLECALEEKFPSTWRQIEERIRNTQT